jgi:3,4-dihydroxy 2-butanone 4-phosphate synthase/GTP cyclohydrolase II
MSTLTPSLVLQLKNLKQKVEHAVQQFSQGSPVLIGDDGKRENEVDFVFHSSFASTNLVNLAITHAKGLLCVALDHQIADRLGLHTAPQFPGSMSHTNFTLSVDARHQITSGISAKDRAYTIQLMASAETKPSDFITPGHVFPVRAVEGGLLARAGHTEALYELCLLSNLPCAAAMCEVLGEAGEPIPPDRILKDHAFSKLPFITTIDLLWYKIFHLSSHAEGPLESLTTSHDLKNGYSKHTLCFKEEECLTLPCCIQFYSQQFHFENLRIVLNNGFCCVDNGVKQEDCFAEIVLFNFENLTEELPQELSLFCDLSARIGLKNTKISVRRLITLARAIQFIANKTKTKLTSNDVNKISFPIEKDGEIIQSLLK